IAPAGANDGRSALVADPRSKQAWRTANADDSKFRPMTLRWTGHGNASTFTCSEPVQSILFNGATRLGLASTLAGYDYAAATPEWNPSGSPTVNPPPACQYTYSGWSACKDGLQTRVATASPAGCAGTPPSDSTSRSCAVTPPPGPQSGIDPASVTVVANSADQRS